MRAALIHVDERTNMTQPIVAFREHVSTPKLHQIVYVAAGSPFGQKRYCLELTCSERSSKVETRKKKWCFILNSPPLVQFDAQHTHYLVAENSTYLPKSIKQYNNTMPFGVRMLYSDITITQHPLTGLVNT